jgi:hypothetical protein
MNVVNQFLILYTTQLIRSSAALKRNIYIYMVPFTGLHHLIYLNIWLVRVSKCKLSNFLGDPSPKTPVFSPARRSVTTLIELAGLTDLLANHHRTSFPLLTSIAVPSTRPCITHFLSHFHTSKTNMFTFTHARTRASRSWTPKAYEGMRRQRLDYPTQIGLKVKNRDD